MIRPRMLLVNILQGLRSKTHNRICRADTVKTVWVPIEHDFIELLKGKRRQGIFLPFQLGQELGKNFSRFSGIKCRLPNNIPHKIESVRKKARQKISFYAKSVFAAETVYAACHVSHCFGYLHGGHAPGSLG